MVTIAWELFSFIIRKSIPTPRLPTAMQQDVYKRQILPIPHFLLLTLMSTLPFPVAGRRTKIVHTSHSLKICNIYLYFITANGKSMEVVSTMERSHSHKKVIILKIF